ncbi:FUSC family protein [Streptomyces cocklensis]|uniref:FUSC family protein n=1 Tax=Actinacidiphila cocklensis TaxID=887465 RepID=UPI00203ECA61|nr:FUSC family protein [Actinacidiphila cocklensis]MDD1061593.1 FUSC family protein [Actinacidiphila cocklensis]
MLTFVEWLVRGCEDRPQPFVELPGDTSRRKLTRPLALFAVLRAVAIAGSVALAFGPDLPDGSWIPIAAVVAMKPSLEQGMLVSVQRLAGAVIGAVVAVLLLLVPASEHGLRLITVTSGLEVVALVLLVHAVGIRFLNYALYCAAVAAGVLILIDLPQPSRYAAEGYRVLWTVCGAGTGLIVMLPAGLAAKRKPQAPPKGA